MGVRVRGYSVDKEGRIALHKEDGQSSEKMFCGVGLLLSSCPGQCLTDSGYLVDCSFTPAPKGFHWYGVEGNTLSQAGLAMFLPLALMLVGKGVPRLNSRPS